MNGLGIKNYKTLGLGEMAIARTGSLKIMALGSCVAVIAIVKRHSLVGMAHVVLPDSQIDPEKSKTTPGFFADQAIHTLLVMLKEAGVDNQRDIAIKLVGGAKVMLSSRDIGKRNVLACRKALWQRRMAAIAEDVGSNLPRTVSVIAESGKVMIRSSSKGKWEI